MRPVAYHRLSLRLWGVRSDLQHQHYPTHYSKDAIFKHKSWRWVLTPSWTQEEGKKKKALKIYSLWNAKTEIKLTGGNAEEGEAFWHNRVWWQGLFPLLDSRGEVCHATRWGQHLLNSHFALLSKPELWSVKEVPTHFLQIITYLLHEWRNILSRYPPPDSTHAVLLGPWVIFPLFCKFPHGGIHSSLQKADRRLPRRCGTQRRLVAERSNLEERLGKRGTKFSRLIVTDSRGGHVLC